MYDHKAQYSLDAFETTEREVLAHSPSAEEVYDRHLDQDKLIDALMALTESQRNRVCEHFFLNKTYKEIADAEGVDISAVRRSIHRALRQLRKNIKLFSCTPSHFGQKISRIVEGQIFLPHLDNCIMAFQVHNPCSSDEQAANGAAQ